MRMMSRLAGLAGIMALSAMIESPLNRMSQNGSGKAPGSGYGNGEPMCTGKEIIPSGCKRYTFEDGYSTIASSQKIANRKHQERLACR